MFEIGYRSKVSDNLEVDIELFHTRTRDFSNTVFESGQFNSTEPVGFRGLLDINNVAVYTKQWGGTMAVNIVAEEWQLKPFITLQRTTLYDYSPYLNAPEAPPLPSNNNNPALYNIYSGRGTKMKHAGTPSWYGGAYINWTAREKLNINFNAYYYAAHSQLHSSNLTYNDGQRGVDRLRSKFILNTVIQYAATKSLTLSGNFRNCFNDKSREFYKSDEVPFMFFAGAHFEF
jgi:iron complex outermembrane receptor protein